MSRSMLAGMRFRCATDIWVAAVKTEAARAHRTTLRAEPPVPFIGMRNGSANSKHVTHSPMTLRPRWHGSLRLLRFPGISHPLDTIQMPWYECGTRDPYAPIQRHPSHDDHSCRSRTFRLRGRADCRPLRASGREKRTLDTLEHSYR